MSDTQHTPGPWHCHGDGWITSDSVPRVACVADDDVLEGAVEVSDAQRDADARLIAAAPELLSALEGFVSRLNTRSAPRLAGDPLFVQALVDSARAAIAKAVQS